MTPTILIAGGGTGGHVFPGLAVAEALKHLAHVEVVFAGSPRGLESRVVPSAGYALELLDVEPMKGGGVGRTVRGAFVAAKATLSARALARRIKPAAVLSVGGYAAGPAALACATARIPLAILEPNSTLGLANKLLGPFADRAYLAWATTARHFRADKSKLYGVPLRAAFAPRAYKPSAGLRRLLVLGGSQGARALNEVLPLAAARIARSLPLSIVHQAGRDRDESVRLAYKSAGMKDVEVVPFLDDVAERMASADLIVGRAGAVTVAEISAIGRAALFVPFPEAADDHQAKNAQSLAELGGGVCLLQAEANETRLASEIESLLADDARRVRMADAARAHGKADAAEHIARDLLELAGIPERKRDQAKKNGAENGSSSHFKVASAARKELS